MPHTLLRLAGALCLLFAGVQSVLADDYPSKPIKVITGTSAGSPSDIRARTIAAKFSESMRQPVVVENRPGASGSIAAEALARSAPDGYTLLIGGQSEIAVYPSLGGKVRYDAEKDFATVGIATYGHAVLVVRPELGIKSVAELIDRAKAAPDSLTCSTVGAASFDDFGCQWLAKRAGVRIRSVHYKSGAQAGMAAATGEVDIAIQFLVAVAKQYIAPGKLKPLAILGPERSKIVPDVPTIAEVGYPGIEIPGWVGVFAPAATPSEIVAKLNRELIKAMGDPAIAETVTSTGSISPSWSPAEASAFVRKERATWSRAPELAGVRLEQ